MMICNCRLYSSLQLSRVFMHTNLIDLPQNVIFHQDIPSTFFCTFVLGVFMTCITDFTVAVQTKLKQTTL